MTDFFGGEGSILNFKSDSGFDSLGEGNFQRRPKKSQVI